MSFFTKLFELFSSGKKSAESVVLIDIGASSVAGAYARFVENKTPVLLYTKRLQFVAREGEPYERAMSRALNELCENLIREGAPILARTTGSGASDAVLVSIDTPDEKITIRTENFERADSFIFTKNISDTILERTRTISPDKSLIDESIVDTVLNGYVTHSPYGKEAHRASLTVITSFIDKNISESIISAVRGLFHTKEIKLISGGSLRYQAMCAAFPHERKPDASSLEQALDAAHSGKLWIPGNPPKIVPVLASHISGLVRQTTATPPDLQILFMAIYHQACLFNKKI